MIWTFREGQQRTFSSSMAFRAFARSSLVFFSTSSASSSNFRLTPRPSLSLRSCVAALPLVFLVAPSIPIIVFSKSLTLLSLSSSAFSLFCSSSSLLLRSPSFSNLLISFLWAKRLLTIHSRQKMSPSEAHATGSREGWRQRLQLANGRKESRCRRVERVPQEDFNSARS